MENISPEAIQQKNDAKLKKVEYKTSPKTEFSFGKVSSAELSEFARKLATIVDAGVPLLRGLRIMRKQERNPKLLAAINGMSDAVEGGSTFSEALCMYPNIFGHTFVNMVRAGECCGVLEITLGRLADYIDKEEEIKKSVISSFLLALAATGIVSILSAVILLPINPVVVGGIIFALFLAVGAKLAKTYCNVSNKRDISTFSRMLGTLLNSGVPVLQSLNIVRDTSRTKAFADATQMVHDSVKEGDTISTPLEQYKFIPSMVVSMIDVGEETGALPEMLMKIADTYDKDIDRAISKINFFNTILLSISVSALTAIILLK